MAGQHLPRVKRAVASILVLAEPGLDPQLLAAAGDKKYLERCASEFGIQPHVHFGAEVVSARWDEESERSREAMR